MKKYFKKLITLFMQRRGYPKYFAFQVFQMQVDDLLHNKETSLRQKLWAHKRGFLSHKIERFGLTDVNYQDYLSDFDFYKLYPINGIYGRWIDDKIIYKLILQPFAKYLPEYYFHLTQNEILRLADCPKDVDQSVEGIVGFLKAEGTLAAKPFLGTSGKGFIKLSYCDKRFLINDEPVTEIGLVKLLHELSGTAKGGYLLTEYVNSCDPFSRVWPNTSNALRVYTIREKGNQPQIVFASMRFGTEKSGIVDNTYAGGVSCAVDLQTGYYDDGWVYKKYQQIKAKYHPDSKVLVEGTIPHWDLIKSTIIEICAYVPQLVFLSFDIVVTEDSFKIIEVNSHGTIISKQGNIPLLKDEKTKDFFSAQLKRIR